MPHNRYQPIADNKPSYYDEEYTPVGSLPMLFWPAVKRTFVLMCTFPWVGLKWAVSRLFGARVRKEVLPAYQNEKERYTDPNTPEAWAFQDACFKKVRETKNVNLKWIKVTTSDAELDTVEISPKEGPITPTKKQSRPHIIRFLGNTIRYRLQMDEAIDEVQEHDCHIVLFDYRGVGLSRGELRSQWDLVRDGVAAVRRLLDEGIPPEKITLDGQSLGGVVATLTAKYLYDRGIHVKVFSDRSLSSTTHFVVAWIRGFGYEDGYHTSFLGRIAGWIAYPIVKLAVSLVDWDMEAGKAFRSLPVTHREHLVLRSDKHQRNPPHADNPAMIVDTPIDDHVIRHWASIHAALRGERRPSKRALKREGKSKQEIKQQVSDYHKASVYIEKAKEILPLDALWRTPGWRHLPGTVIQSHLQEFGHGVSKSLLTMRCPPPYAPSITPATSYTAQQFFWHFVEHGGGSDRRDVTPQPARPYSQGQIA
jgi:pimeloyl-ACP methyl ester carboxylesterase